MKYIYSCKFLVRHPVHCTLRLSENSVIFFFMWINISKVANIMIIISTKGSKACMQAWFTYCWKLADLTVNGMSYVDNKLLTLSACSGQIITSVAPILFGPSPIKLKSLLELYSCWRTFVWMLNTSLCGDPLEIDKTWNLKIKAWLYICVHKYLYK